MGGHSSAGIGISAVCIRHLVTKSLSLPRHLMKVQSWSTWLFAVNPEPGEASIRLSQLEVS